MTLQVFQNYSVTMEAEFNALDEKVQQMVALCRRLRQDNSALRQQLASANTENQRLSEKISTAAERLEALIGQVPEEGA